MLKIFASFLWGFMVFCIQTAYGQAKNAIGFGPAVNISKTGSYDPEGGIGARLQGEIKLANKFSVVPAIGVETPYNVYLGVSGKYYPAHRFYVLLGGIAYLGGDISGGVGPSAGFGYQLLKTKRHFLDMDFHAEIIKVDPYENTTITGLRLTYNFSFSSAKKD